MNKSLEELRTGSDYSGVGAFDYALERMGAKQDKQFACDLDKWARKTYLINHGTKEDVLLLESEEVKRIDKFYYKKYIEQEEYEDDWVTQNEERVANNFSFYYPWNVYSRTIPEKPLDVYMTSPPCQAFSIAGKRMGEEDKRGILFYNSHEFIKKNKPRYFQFENVKGLLSHDKRNNKAEYGNTFSNWINLLGGKSVNGNPTLFADEDAVPYHIYFKVQNATEFDIPQNRERVFIIGIRDDSDNVFRWPIEKKQTRVLKDLLELNVEEKYFLSEKAMNYLIRGKEKGRDRTNITKGDGVCTTITANYRKGVHNQGETYVRTEEAKKVDFVNIDNMNCITTSQSKYNFICVPCLTPEREETRQDGRRFKKDGDPAFTINTQDRHGVLIQKEYTKGNSQAERVYDPEGVSCSLQAEAGGGGGKTGLYEIETRIRRLIPLECNRLMDFPERHKIEVSDSQAYKQAGNSICVGVLVANLERLKYD